MRRQGGRQPVSGGGAGASSSGAVPPLHRAVLQGRTAEVAALLQSAKKQALRLLGSTDGYGNTALHVAACADAVECIKLIVSKGAVLNVRIVKGVTPLWVASLTCNPGAVRSWRRRGPTWGRQSPTRAPPASSPPPVLAAAPRAGAARRRWRCCARRAPA